MLPTIRALRFFPCPTEVALGSIATILEKEKLSFDLVDLIVPENRPKPHNGRALIILGGPMGAYETEKHPQLLTALDWIDDALQRELPILGICLGAQLTAKKLGAEVHPHAVAETGWTEISFTEEALADPLISFSPRKMTLSEWHSDTFQMPAGSTLLATSDACPRQGFRYGNKVYGFQFHPEANENKVNFWRRHIENNPRMEIELAKKLVQEWTVHGPAQLDWMRQFMHGFLQLI